MKIIRQWYLKFFITAGAAIFLFSCDKPIIFHPKKPDSFMAEAHRQYTSSTRLSKEFEQRGTIIRVASTVTAKKNNRGWEISRTTDSTETMGYNKDLIGQELVYGVSVDAQLDTSFKIKKITGLDSAITSVRNLSKVSHFHNRLTASVDTAEHRKWLSDAWVLRNALPRGEYQAGQNIDTAGINRHLTLIRADSIKILRQRYRRGKRCVEYNVFYRRPDSIRLDIEQFFVANDTFLVRIQFDKSRYLTPMVRGVRQIKPGFFEKEMLHGEWMFSINSENGLPCFESRKESAQVIVRDPEISHTKMNVTIYRFGENVYRYKEK